MQRAFTSILSTDVDRAANFYEQLFGMSRHYDSDWFVILCHEKMASLELGILQYDHDIVPSSIRSKPAGVMITFVVDNCDVVYEAAVKLKAKIVEPPTDMPYGQRRFLTHDIDGTVLDISSPIPMSGR